MVGLPSYAEGEGEGEGKGEGEGRGRGEEGQGERKGRVKHVRTVQCTHVPCCAGSP